MKQTKTDGGANMERVKNSEKAKPKSITNGKKKDKIRKWEKPALEDVSGRVMAQPYIRFT